MSGVVAERPIALDWCGVCGEVTPHTSWALWYRCAVCRRCGTCGGVTKCGACLRYEGRA